MDRALRFPAGAPAFPAGFSPSERALVRMVRFGEVELPALSLEEWQWVAYVARREGLAPLLRAAARDASVPATVAADLDTAYASSAAAVTPLYGQLAAVLAALRGAEIRALLLKGAALAGGIYQDAALRPFSDLDLLVRVQDIDHVHHTLTGLGYDIDRGVPSDADRTWRHGRGYFDPDGRRVPVDVHWRYAGYPLTVPMDYEPVFTRAIAFPLTGRTETAEMPAGADMVIALSIHFLRDLWYGKARLRYLRDLAEVAGRGEVNWAQINQSVKSSPLLRSPLFVALGAASALLRAPVPPEVLGSLRPPRWGFVSHRLLARVSRHVMRRERPVVAVGEIALMRGLDAGIAEILRWLWALLAVPRPLAPSQRRWMHYLRGGPFRGTAPRD